MSDIKTQAVNYISRFVGLPYVWGGDDPVGGFDCSGLAIEMLKAIGLVKNSFDTTASGLLNKYQNIKVDKPEKGCLVFFGTSQKATHVGICLDDILMLEAGGGGSRVNDSDDAEKYNAYIRVRPIRCRSDLLAFVDPFKLVKGG